MSYSKIAPFILYLVIGITIPVMIFFFAGDKLVDKNQYDSRVNKIGNAGQAKGPSLISDLQSADSLATTADSLAQSAQIVPSVDEPSEKVQLSFLEKLVYYKTDIPLIWGYILLIIAVSVALIFPIIYMFLHPTNLVRTLLVLVGIAVVVGLAFLAAPGTAIEIPGYTGDINTKAMALKLIDTGLIFSYFILGMALLSVVLSEVVLYFR
jgi:hypothetical protein